jgi:Mannosylglycerate hydrolase MGH1-like glycoside hydrolase domain
MVLAPASEVVALGQQDRLLREAVRVLLQNWHGHATVPSRSLYPHQWSWDSAFIALGLQHISPERAATELFSLFGAQWADGRIPQIAFNPAVPDDAYFPGPSVWRSSAIEGHPPIDTSGIIQPPLHALAVASIVPRLGDRGLRFAERAYPHLVDQNAYIRRRRTVEGGLAALVHPWETGLDNSPTWDRPLAVVPADLTLFERYTRRDVVHAGVGERPTDQDYARYIRLMLKYRDHGYDDDWVRTKGEFRVVDPAFNALWAWSELALAEIAPLLGRDASEHVAEAARITAAMVNLLWSAERGLFLARDERSGKLLSEPTVAGLIPLVLPGLPSEVTAALVDTATGEAFRLGAPGVHGVPSFDLTDVRHEPRRYWRGPTWLNTTWLVARGLEVHGHHELARRLDDDLVWLVAKSGFREYFHPLTGRGHGTRSFSWSAALLVHVLVGSD